MYIPNSIIANLTNATIVQGMQYNFAIPYYPYLIVILVIGIASTITKKISYGMIFGSLTSYLLTALYSNFVSFSILLTFLTALTYAFEIFMQKEKKEKEGDKNV